MTLHVVFVLGFVFIGAILASAFDSACTVPSVRPGHHAGVCRGIGYTYRVPRQCAEGGCSLLFNGHLWTNPLARSLTTDSLSVGKRERIVVVTLDEKPPAPTLSSRWIFEIGSFRYERVDGVMTQIWSSPQGPFKRIVYATFAHDAGATSFSGSMTWPEHSFTNELGITSDWPVDTRLFQGGIINGNAIEWQVLNTNFRGNLEGAFTVPQRRIIAGVANNSDIGAVKLFGEEIAEPWTGCVYSRLWALVSAAQVAFKIDPGQVQFAGFQLDSHQTWEALVTHAANCSSDG